MTAQRESCAARGAVASDGELHTFHCLYGWPLGAPATNDTIVREIYALSSNDLTKMADWGTHRVTPASIGSSGERDWQADPALTADERLTPQAYDGANRASHIDRAHQTSLAAMSGTPFAADSLLRKLSLLARTPLEQRTPVFTSGADRGSLPSGDEAALLLRIAGVT